VTSERVVLITGSRKGIGRALAEHFLAQGAIVEGCSRQPADWEAEGYTHHIADVLNDGQVRTMMAAIGKRHGRLDVLVNNAGIASMNLAMLTPTETAQRIVNTNFLGTFLVCREAARLMMRRRYGRIINLSTVAIPTRLAGESLYAASKAAVTTFSQIFAREVAGYGITCNVVGPTAIQTDLLRSVPSETIDSLLEMLPLKRFGTFEDVANVVDFFASPASGMVTGQVVYLGGA
jgi:3-oxoacyl-[acyl-carrier protein] reductase